MPAAAADACAMVPGGGGHSLSGAAAQRRGPRAGYGDGSPDSDARDSQPDPGRQDSPDLFRDADWYGPDRNADVQSGFGQRLFRQADHAGYGLVAFIESR